MILVGFVDSECQEKDFIRFTENFKGKKRIVLEVNSIRISNKIYAKFVFLFFAFFVFFIFYVPVYILKGKFYFGDVRFSISKILYRFIPKSHLVIGYDGTGSILWVQYNSGYYDIFTRQDLLIDDWDGCSLLYDHDNAYIISRKTCFDAINNHVAIIGQPFCELGICSEEDYFLHLRYFLNYHGVKYFPHRRENNKKNIYFCVDGLMSCWKEYNFFVGFSSTFFIDPLTTNRKGEFILLPIPGEGYTKRRNDAILAREYLLRLAHKKKYSIRKFEVPPI